MAAEFADGARLPRGRILLALPAGTQRQRESRHYIAHASEHAVMRFARRRFARLAACSARAIVYLRACRCWQDM